MVIAIFLICLAMVLFSVSQLFRNERVHRERTRILARIHLLSDGDIIAGREWRWRYEAFDSGPSYDEMFYKFWRPIASFYPSDLGWLN